MSEPPPGGPGAMKPCDTCGKAFGWRRAWAEIWDELRHCSVRCRENPPGPLDRALESAILAILRAREPGATACPSEAARLVAPDGWRGLMDSARNAARRLTARGALEIVQRGRVVNPTSARGPVRLRLPPRP